MLCQYVIEGLFLTPEKFYCKDLIIDICNQLFKNLRRKKMPVTLFACQNELEWGLAKSSLPPIFANKTLSEHKHAYQRLYVWLLLCVSVASTSDPPNLNYLLTGFLQREFPNFKLDWKEDSEFYLLISTPQKRTQMEIFRISVLLLL